MAGQQPIAPQNDPRRAGLRRGTLASVVGVAVAGALFVSIPADESGRKVEATVEADGTARIRHVSGRQYLRVYLDIVGVATACDGLTRDEQGRPLRLGGQFTEAQCTVMLERALVAHAEGVMACSPGLALSPDVRIERQREGPRFAAVSLAYNVGVGRPPAGDRRGTGYCGSTARRMFNAGAYRAGCDALLPWNKAGGRVVRGLVLRRERERAICINGLPR